MCSKSSDLNNDLAQEEKVNDPNKNVNEQKKEMFNDGPPPSYETVSKTSSLTRNSNIMFSEEANEKNDPIEFFSDEIINNNYNNNLDTDCQTIHSRTSNSQRQHNKYTYDIIMSDKLDPDYDLIIRRDDYIQNQLEKNYPFKYILLDSLIMTILNVTLIILQVYAINNNAALSYLGSAIWAGLYNLGAVCMVLCTIKYRNPTLMLATTVVKLFGMIISFGGFILVHMVAFYHYNCIAASYYRPCYNKNMLNIHYCIIILGIPCLISSVGFFIYFQIKLIGRFSVSNKHSNQMLDEPLR